MCLEIIIWLGLIKILLSNYIIQFDDRKQRDIDGHHRVIKMSESKTLDSIFSYLYFSDTYDLNLIIHVLQTYQ